MNFSTYFSKQARRPDGLFGRIVMKLIFDLGNVFLNENVNELMDIHTDDRIIDIGCGTGKLIFQMAKQIDDGFIEGVDFSSEMVSIAQNRNRKNIAKGKIEIVEGDFDELPYTKELFSKACSVNTIYFWPTPLHTMKKIAEILKPSGKLILAFEDIEQLKMRKLNYDVFRLYTKDSVQELLIEAGFSDKINIISKEKSNLIFHWIIAKK